MKTHKIGIIMNGVTGRMGKNQHLIRSILAIRDQGGIVVSPDEKIAVDPILTGRNENKLKEIAETYGVEKWTTDLDSVLADDAYQIFFDASSTLHRARFVEMAVKRERQFIVKNRPQLRPMRRFDSRRCVAMQV